MFTGRSITVMVPAFTLENELGRFNSLFKFFRLAGFTTLIWWQVIIFHRPRYFSYICAFRALPGVNRHRLTFISIAGSDGCRFNVAFIISMRMFVLFRWQVILRKRSNYFNLFTTFFTLPCV